MMTTRLLERAANEVDFKSSNFFVEVYAAGDVMYCCIAGAVMRCRNN